jgi:hypothetical protein
MVKVSRQTGLSITVARFPFTALTCLFYTKCNRLKARLLSPEPTVVEEPQSTRSEEPTLLCNNVGSSTQMSGYPN